MLMEVQMHKAGSLKPLILGDLVIQIPIVQGGMGVAVSTAPMVSAVSNYGGLGVLATVALGHKYELDYRTNYKGANERALRKEIRRIRSMTDRPFGVNIMLALTDASRLMEVAVDEGVAALILSTMLPLSMPEKVLKSQTRIIPKISSKYAADITCMAWKRRYGRLPDAFILETPLSGGHLGIKLEELKNLQEHTLDKIMPDFIRDYRGTIPMIAAGGIFDGRDIARALNLGADGVLLGSRFVCTHECEVAPEFKQAYLDAEEEDIVIIQSPVGLPARVIKNNFYERIRRGEAFPKNCPVHCLNTCDPKKSLFCIGEALFAAKHGNMDDGLVLCSTTTHRNKEIVSIKALMDTLVSETLENLPYDFTDYTNHVQETAASA